MVLISNAEPSHLATVMREVPPLFARFSFPSVVKSKTSGARPATAEVQRIGAAPVLDFERGRGALGKRAKLLVLGFQLPGSAEVLT